MIPSNVVSIVGRADRERGTQHEHSADDRRKRPDATLADSVRQESAKLERVIAEVELARDRIELSAVGAVDALRRFEQTLFNLRLSIENQRSSSVVIDSAAAAGEAAARMKALSLGGGINAKTVLRHEFTREGEAVVKRVLTDAVSEHLL